MANSYSFTFSQVITEPPSGNQIRLDAAYPYITVGNVWIRNLTTDGIDVHLWLMNVAVDSTLYIQDRNDHTLYARFKTTAAPVDKDAYVELPAIWVANGAALLNQAAEVVVVAPGIVLPPGQPSAVLVTLDQAKAHLQIFVPLDAAPEADLQLKLDQAEGVILDYLKSRADPTWTAETVPKPVTAAILIYLAHIYERRGDDMGGTTAGLPDQSVWDAIGRLLARLRDPALA